MAKFIKYQYITLQKRLAYNYKKWLFSFVGSLLGITAVFIFHRWLGLFSHFDTIMLIGSFGASAVIIYGTPQSPYALPRHAIGGHLISAFIGVTLYKWFGQSDLIWLCCALAVALSVFAMQVTRTTHPPGGATALIAVIGTSKVHSFGYFYLISPVLSGILIILSVSTLMQRLFKSHHLKFN